MDAMDRFPDIPWTEIAPHAYEKRVVVTGHALRLVRFEPGFIESDWCERPHFGYVIEGHLTIAHEVSQVKFSPGDYVALEGGPGSRHRAIVSESVTLFLVEPISR